MRSFFLAAALMLAAAPALADTVPPPTPEDVAVRIAANQDGQTIEAVQGENIAIELQSNPSTGSSWVVTSKPDFLDDAGQATEPVTASANGRPLLGAPRWQVFMFTANAAGSGEVSLELRGPGATSRGTFTVTINAQ